MDHLIYCAPELESGIARMEELTGVRPIEGGRHREWGTRNALLSLGSDAYLEIVAPDSQREDPAPPTLFGVDRVRELSFRTWCARAEDLESRVEAAGAAGVELGPILEGGRDRPDGSRITWRISDPEQDRMGGIVPFLISWGTTPHPAGSAPGGVRLESLLVEHPDPTHLGRILAALGVDVPVRSGPVAAVVVRLDTPRGVVEHRSDS